MSLFVRETENCPEDVKERSRQQYRKYAKTISAYNFVVNYARIMTTCPENTPEGIFAKRFAWTLGMESNRDINSELRLVELEKDLVPLVESTDNKIFFRPLFFPSIFINNDFHFEKLIIKGIYVTQCHTEKGTSAYRLHDPDVNDYAIFAVVADINETCEYYVSIALVDRIMGDQFLDSKEERKTLGRCAEHVRTLVCNIVDMVEGNTDDLSVITIETTKEQNAKRIRRRQIPTPTRIVIRAKDNFKKYVKKFNDDLKDVGSRKIGCKFLVMGHYRHFRDEKFKNVQGTKKWIKPHWKGEGIIVAKEYDIKK